MELGSDFELDISNLTETEDNIFQYLNSYYAIYMDSGRSAAIILNTILRSGVILLPSYICESIINVYKDLFTIRFYDIKDDLTVDIKDFECKLNEDVTVVYVMHYFGQLQDREFLEYLHDNKQWYGFTILEDTTHSIFTARKTVGDYCICSLRKWFPIMDGGVLYSEHKLDAILGQDIPYKMPSEKLYAMMLKHLYIKEGLDCNKLYRKIFVDEEEKLDNRKEVYYMSALSRCLLTYFSVSELMEKRKQNFQELAKTLRKLGINEILKDEDFVPLCYPVYIENRDEFRKHLMEHQVYCAVHWPLEGTGLEKHGIARHMSQNMISFPIDQRYGKEHMQYLSDLIENYWKY